MTPTLLWAGVVLVSLWLLKASHGLDRRDLRASGAFRGAAVGFLLGTGVALGVLLAPPMRWPPGATQAAILVLAVPLTTLLGALLGRVRAGRTG